MAVPPEVRTAILDLRAAIDQENLSLLSTLSRRQGLADRIGELKASHGQRLFDPSREAEMITALLAANAGPLGPDAIRTIFTEVFHQSRRRLGAPGAVLSEAPGQPLFTVRGHAFGPAPVVIAGPLFVEPGDDLEPLARGLALAHVPFLRGVVGPSRPGTPISEDGLRALRTAADAYGLGVVTEISDPADVERVAAWADILQIGNRNMFRRDLLHAAGATGRPVLLKRGQLATLDEFLASAEVAAEAGARPVILCERGTTTPNGPVVDIAAIPTLRLRTPWPVVLDVSHATSDPALLAPLGRAALAAGAHGVMVLVHEDPARARHDGSVQLDPEGFRHFHEDVLRTGRV